MQIASYVTPKASKKYRIFWKLEPWKIILLPLMDKLKAKLYVLDRYRSETTSLSGQTSFQILYLFRCIVFRFAIWFQLRHTK